MEFKYPPCGRFCEVCESKTGEHCRGCVESDGKPYYSMGGVCPAWACAQKKNKENCGQCVTFPCETYLDTYNPERGRRSVLSYIGLLFLRNKKGAEAWKKWARINKEVHY
jgi:hypothetical protein